LANMILVTKKVDYLIEILKLYKLILYSKWCSKNFAILKKYKIINLSRTQSRLLI